MNRYDATSADYALLVILSAMKNASELAARPPLHLDEMGSKAKGSDVLMDQRA